MKKEKIIGENLLALKKRFDLYRQKHRGGGRFCLTEELWDEAVNVARVEGIATTAHVLKLNYSRLKHRMQGLETQIVKHESSAAFVQLEMPMSLHEKHDKHMVIELSTSRGDRMRIETADSSHLDVVGLAQAFWRQAS